METPWTDIITAVGTALGAAFTALGLGFIVFQLRAARRQLTITSFDHLYSRMHRIHELFLERPGLRPYFYGGEEPHQGLDNYCEICIAAEMIADFFQQVNLELDLMPQSTADGWKAYMCWVIQQSPALCNHLNVNHSWYPTRLLKFADIEPAAEEATLPELSSDHHNEVPVA